MKTLMSSLALILAVTLPAYSQNGPRGNGPGTPAAIVPATTEEAQWLTHMREEEKLARDVYTALAAKWNLAALENIATSEDRHFASIGTLLTRYGLTDPAGNNPAGVFTDPRFNTLYAELMAKGTKSIQDAIEVGLLIETTDITDLEVALKATTKTDLKRVFTNLQDGSYSHQEAFQANLDVICALTR